MQKALPSIINVIIVFLLSSSIYFTDTSNIDRKLFIVGVFFLYTLVFLIFNKNRDLGMMIVGSYWKNDYPVYQHLIYNILYTASFATLLFSIFFPLDLFLINMVLIQLPAIIFTGTTFHGFVAGGISTIIK